MPSKPRPMTRSILRARPAWSNAPSALNGVTVMLNRPRNRAWHSVMSFMIPVLPNVKMFRASAGDAPDRAVDGAERAAPCFGDDHRLADADGELAEDSQGHGDVERHARPQFAGDAGIEAEDAALAPVGSKGNADAVAGALPEVVGIAG